MPRKTVVIKQLQQINCSDIWTLAITVLLYTCISKLCFRHKKNKSHHVDFALQNNIIRHCKSQ